MPCVQSFMTCLTQAEIPLPDTPAQRDKARLQAFLASRQKPGLRLGEAAEKGDLPFNLPAFASLPSFCEQL